MNDNRPAPTPILDHYGIWASHRKLEPDGTIWSQDPPRGVKIEIETARKSDVFFHKERPWERGANLHLNSMIYDQGRYRLWYGVTKVSDVSRNYVCYAESEDGFNWERPELGLIDYDGSTRNNIICHGKDHHLGFVFIDPSAPEEERYKAIAGEGRFYRDGKLDENMDGKKFKELMIAMDVGGVSPEDRRKAVELRQAVHASVSPDGIRWKNIEGHILDVGASALDTHNLCIYDPYEKKYVAYLRGHLERRRSVRRAEGTEFRNLQEPRLCLMCDPQDPIGDDIYNPCYSPYPGRRLYLMFPSFYHRIPSTVDIQLAISHDSYNWSRPERKPIIDLSYEGGEYGSMYASPSLVALDSGEWRLPFVGNQRKHDFLDRGRNYPEDGEFRWASWREDRLAGLHAAAEGSVVLVQRPCAGKELRLNYRTEKDGWVKVELVNPPVTPPRPVQAFEGFGLDAAETLSGDELSRVVRWNGKSDLSMLRGKEVSVRLHLKRAKVFSTAL